MGSSEPAAAVCDATAAPCAVTEPRLRGPGGHVIGRGKVAHVVDRGDAGIALLDDGTVARFLMSSSFDSCAPSVGARILGEVDDQGNMMNFLIFG